MDIDIDKLRNDLKGDSLAAFFGAGYGGALMESFDVERMSSEKLVEMAKKRGFDLRRYRRDID